jgi:hypothetical protein
LVRFRRRGETQSSNVRRLLESVIDCHGEQSLHGFVVTADLGYGNIALLEDLIQHGISANFHNARAPSCMPSICWLVFSERRSF